MGWDLGLLGGGQLARMSAQAARRMGLACRVLDPDPSAPAAPAADVLVGALDDPERIAELARTCRGLSLENEFVPAAAVRAGLALAGREERAMLPSVECLATIQDKLAQRLALARAGVPAPRAAALEGDGSAAVEAIGFPMVLKARFGGYDGKGTRLAKTPEALAELREPPEGGGWGAGGWLAESFVPFRRELAVMVARGPHECLELDVVETQQREFVCDVTYPARLWNPNVDAGGVPVAAVEAVGGYGLFGVELFELEDGSVLVNELAPRPHNTGHYTLDWGDLSQFELHVRLSLGLPLPAPGDGRLVGNPVYMANLFGQAGAADHRRGIARALEIEPNARIHWYDKRESRPGRKMGHLNLVARRSEPPHELLPHLERVRAAFYEGWLEP